MTKHWDGVDYRLERRLIEINNRYERGEITRAGWIDERTKAGAKNLINPPLRGETEHDK